MKLEKKKKGRALSLIRTDGKFISFVFESDPNSIIKDKVVMLLMHIYKDEPKQPTQRRKRKRSIKKSKSKEKFPELPSYKPETSPLLVFDPGAKGSHGLLIHDFKIIKELSYSRKEEFRMNGRARATKRISTWLKPFADIFNEFDNSSADCTKRLETLEAKLKLMDDPEYQKVMEKIQKTKISYFRRKEFYQRQLIAQIPKDTIIAYGAAKFKEFKGSVSSGIGKFLQLLQTNFEFHYVNEYNTSKKCYLCEEDLDQVKDHWRLKYCVGCAVKRVPELNPFSLQKSGTPLHVNNHHRHRDTNACLNIYKRFFKKFY